MSFEYSISRVKVRMCWDFYWFFIYFKVIILRCWPFKNTVKKNCAATLVLLQKQLVLHSCLLIIKLAFFFYHCWLFSVNSINLLIRSWPFLAQEKKRRSVNSFAAFFDTYTQHFLFSVFFPSVCIPIRQQSNQQLHLEQWETICKRSSFSL